METLRGFVKGVQANLIDSSVLESPKYTVKDDTLDGYEERHYPAARWVSTRIGNEQAGGETLEQASGGGFRRLFNYITGSNDKKQKVEMTAPVLVRVVPGKGPACESHGEMMFYVPQQFQDNCPEPAGKDVYIQELPEMTCYVSRFGGRIRGEQWFQHAEELAAKLEKDGKSHEIESRFWFYAGYNSPFQMFDRRNEILYVKKPKE